MKKRPLDTVPAPEHSK